MGWFKPFKKPNGFKYTPRFYDPVKEAREQRRRELRGESVETDNCEYRPGQGRAANCSGLKCIIPYFQKSNKRG